MKKEELVEKLKSMGAHSDDAEKIAGITSRKEAARELLDIRDVRTRIGAKDSDADVWRAEEAMKRAGIYYEFKG